MKDYDDTHYYNKWLEIVRRMTHEGAPWFSEHNCEKYVLRHWLSYYKKYKRFKEHVSLRNQFNNRFLFFFSMRGYRRS